MSCLFVQKVEHQIILLQEVSDKKGLLKQLTYKSRKNGQKYYFLSNRRILLKKKMETIRGFFPSHKLFIDAKKNPKYLKTCW